MDQRQRSIRRDSHWRNPAGSRPPGRPLAGISRRVSAATPLSATCRRPPSMRWPFGTNNCGWSNGARCWRTRGSVNGRPRNATRSLICYTARFNLPISKSMPQDVVLASRRRDCRTPRLGGWCVVRRCENTAPSARDSAGSALVGHRAFADREGRIGDLGNRKAEQLLRRNLIGRQREQLDERPRIAERVVVAVAEIFFGATESTPNRPSWSALLLNCSFSARLFRLTATEENPGPLVCRVERAL